MPQALDVKRCLALIEQIAQDYDRIHLAGVSYGGLLAGQAYRHLLDTRPDLARKVGVVMSFEGYAPSRNWMAVDEENLFQWNWEMAYPGESVEDFARIAGRPNVYLAYGSCWKEQWEILLADLTDKQRDLTYEDGHEFRPALFLQLLRENRPQ